MISDLELQHKTYVKMLEEMYDVILKYYRYLKDHKGYLSWLDEVENELRLMKKYA